MNRQTLLAALVACFGFAAPAEAQDARIITFHEAVRIALEQNSALQQAENAAQVSEVAVEQARSRFLPDLSLSTRGAQSIGRNFNETEGRIIDSSTRSVNVGLSSSVTLFDGFGNIAALREARFNDEASELEVRRSRETVVFTVAANFLSLLQQQEQLAVQRESLAAESALQDEIASYVEAGARTIADLYQQQASVASARLAVVEAERAAQLAEVDLMQTLQLDPAGAYQFEAVPFDEAAASRDAPTLQAMLAAAYAQRADLHSEASRVAAAQEAIRIAGSGRWPTVSLTSGYGTNYTSASDFGLTEQFDQRRGGSLSLGFSIPLFDRGATSADIRRAELAADNARLALESRRNEVGLDVRRAHLDFRAAREQLSAADAQDKAAQLALQTAQERYQAGAATLVELTQARATQVQAASALVSARSNLLFQRTLIDYYTGELDASETSWTSETS
jgi:outer membrane protein